MNAKTSAMAAVLMLLVCPVRALSQDSLLILAPNEFLDELDPLVRFKNASGRPTTLLGLDDVYAAFSGIDDPERIKKCIAYYESTAGIDHVMLVGDCDQFPVRYCRGYNTEWGTIWLPSDLYYSDVYDSLNNFDDWDGDSDGIVGEMDFAGGEDIQLVNLDDIDLHPDVAVARIPASNETELTRYVRKVIDYELRVPGTWFHNALLINDADFGSSLKMDNDVVPHLGGFTIYRRYQDQSPWDSYTPAQRAAEIHTRLNPPNGSGLVAYYGHGNRTSWGGWYDLNDMSALNNDHTLPVIFATSCYTGRFHFAREYYMDVNGNEWNRLSGPTPPTVYPEPAPIQPAQYDTYGVESFAEQFLVMRDTGGIAYIGATGKGEHGGWLSDPTRSIGLCPYFVQEYAAGERKLGTIWSNTLDRFADDVENIGMYYYAFVQIHKYTLFGDPSLIVGGAFTTSLAGSLYDGAGGPLGSYARYRVTGDVTVPTGTKLTAMPATSVLFNDGKKIVGNGVGPSNGLLVNGTADEPVHFMSLAADPQGEHVIHGIRVKGNIRLRNGGEIKFH